MTLIAERQRFFARKKVDTLTNQSSQSSTTSYSATSRSTPVQRKSSTGKRNTLATIRPSGTALPGLRLTLIFLTMLTTTSAIATAQISTPPVSSVSEGDKSATESKPPTISVRLSPVEAAQMASAWKVQGDAETALQQATKAREDLEYKLIEKYREARPDIGPQPWCDANGSSTMMLQFDESPPLPKPHYTGYLAEIHDGWIVFTLGASQCHGI